MTRTFSSTAPPRGLRATVAHGYLTPTYSTMAERFAPHTEGELRATADTMFPLEEAADALE